MQLVKSIVVQYRRTSANGASCATYPSQSIMPVASGRTCPIVFGNRVTLFEIIPKAVVYIVISIPPNFAESDCKDINI